MSSGKFARVAQRIRQAYYNGEISAEELDEYLDDLGDQVYHEMRDEEAEECEQYYDGN